MNSAAPVQVIVADDHPVYREGLVRALQECDHTTVVAEADTGDAALALIREHQPDVALLDYQMPGLNGSEIAAAVRQEGLPTRVLLVSANRDSTLVYHALQRGAAGFLPKESARSEIVAAVLQCADGQEVLSPALAAGLALEVRRRGERPPTATLSARELEVLKRIAKGQTVVVIADELFLAPSTVKTHVQRLYDKLGVSDRASAVAEAMRQGLVE
ncbi:response regulator transcription factor [Mycobacterium sp. DL592]|uniref:response regulator n=1 Tax=Mycobacterium sp. DL592 TaxID=2675524 RepID=UPI00141E8810|nr:response regulator transcription factor [Mycobacterium sp. DL592]